MCYANKLGRVSKFAIAWVVGLSLISAPGEARTFDDRLRKTRFGRALAQSFARAIGRSLPLLSASTGVRYQLEPALESVVFESAIPGQLFLEPPESVGRKRFIASSSVQYVSVDTVDGKTLDRLHDVRRPIRGSDPGGTFTVPRFGLRLESYQVTTNLTYGVTDDLQVNAAVPVVYSAFGADAALRASQGDFHHVQIDRERGSATGVGDVFLRVKHGLPGTTFLHVASGLTLRIPSGDERNFQGTGEVELSPGLYLASRLITVADQPGVPMLQAYFNGGSDLVPDDINATELRWGAGLDLAWPWRATVGVALLGRHGIRRIAPAGLLTVTRSDGGRAPLFDLSLKRPDYFDLSVGGRVCLKRESVFGFLNVIVPLNRDGFRSDVTPLVGIEAVF